MQNDLSTQFSAFNQKHARFKPSQRIGLAVSGGLDSMVMLELFNQISSEQHLKITVLHFNHQLRGADADADESFVAAICAEKQIVFISDRADVADYAKVRKLSVETAARELRYRFFNEAAHRQALDCIALAHNADDQAETVIAHVMRGAGISGLRGIPVRRGLFIRPLLFAPRRQLAEFAAEHQVRYREDASNSDLKYRRNRIRHQLLPMMRRFNPQIVASLNRLADAAAESEQMIQHQAADALKSCLKEQYQDKIVLDIHAYLAYFSTLQRLILQDVVRSLQEDPRLLTFAVLQNLSRFMIKGASGGIFQLSSAVEIVIAGGDLVIQRSRSSPEDIVLNSLTGNFSLWDGFFLEITPTLKPLTLTEKPSGVEYIDASTLIAPCRVRTFRKGDVFLPINGQGHKKVSDFMIDAKIPAHQRSRIPILECQAGIVWLCGLRLDDRFKIMETTTQVLKLTLGRP
jgi:tRNA(Ile)-lysidine synthase